MNLLKKYIIVFISAVLITACNPHKKLVSSNEKKKETNSHAAKVLSASSIQAKYSTLLNVNTDDIRNIALYSLIDDWYGTTYKYGGCDKNGIDCSNFAAVLYQEIYKKKIQGSSSAIFNQCDPVAKDHLQEGDLIFFKINSKDISHIGVYLQNHKFIHATTQKGVMINDLNEPYYLNYFYKAGRLR